MSASEELESERDFLMRSLDDLELEHESGGIDDESYTALRDDYTARAAATIRAMRDGTDARPAGHDAPPARRRVAVVAVILVFAIVAGVALAAAVGVRLPGQTSSGNAPTSSVDDAASRRIEALKQQVKADPDDYDLRLELGDAYERGGKLLDAIKVWDTAITLDPARAEAFAQRGRVLYVLSINLPSKEAQAQFVANASAAFDKAIEVDPTYVDAFYFRSVLRAATGQYAGSQADLQAYLAASPAGQWRSQAVDLLGRVTAETAKQPSATVPASP